MAFLTQSDVLKPGIPTFLAIQQNNFGKIEEAFQLLYN
jgi:hypothetical protein